MMKDNKMSYDVFISYRREGGLELARQLMQQLDRLGVSCFFDIEEINTGKFDETIYASIDNSRFFVFLATRGALDRCVQEGDWVRKELEYALDKGREPVLVAWKGESVVRFPQNLPDSLKRLSSIQVSFIDRDTAFNATVRDLVERRFPGVVIKDEKRRKIAEETFLRQVDEYLSNDGKLDEGEKEKLDLLAKELGFDTMTEQDLVLRAKENYSQQIESRRKKKEEAFLSQARDFTRTKSRLSQKTKEKLEEIARNNGLDQDQRKRLMSQIESECARRSHGAVFYLLKFLVYAGMGWLLWLLVLCAWRNINTIGAYMWMIFKWPLWAFLVICGFRLAITKVSGFKPRLVSLLVVVILGNVGFFALWLDFASDSDSRVHQSFISAVSTLTPQDVFSERDVGQARSELQQLKRRGQYETMCDFAKYYFNMEEIFNRIGDSMMGDNVDREIFSLVREATLEIAKLKKLGMEQDEIISSRPDLVMKFADIRKAVMGKLQEIVEGGDYEGALKYYNKASEAFEKCSLRPLKRPKFK